MMISEVCHEVKNWFCVDRIFGRFKIQGGVLRFLDYGSSVPIDLGLQDGQYYRIVNSLFNDGVWQYKKPSEPIEPTEPTEPSEPSEPSEDTEEAEQTEETPSEPPAEALVDEVFIGGVWLMAVPRDFLNLVADIEAWNDKYGGVDSAAQSPFSSESFGGYSYSKGSSGSGSGGGAAITWQNNFRSRLNRWRKI